MLVAQGGVEASVRNRVSCAWGKFLELALILTKRGVSLKLKGKFYRACVQRVLLYSSETWAMKAEDVGRLERAENAMARWLCGVTLRDRISTLDVMLRLGVVKVVDMVRRGGLDMLSVRRCDWVSACRNIKVTGSRGRGRPKKA